MEGGGEKQEGSPEKGRGLLGPWAWAGGRAGRRVFAGRGGQLSTVEGERRPRDGDSTWLPTSSFGKEQGLELRAWARGSPPHLEAAGWGTGSEDQCPEWMTHGKCGAIE